MVSILQNFVTLRKTTGDVLPPSTQRSVVEMIVGILKRYDFEEFNAAYSAFLRHISDFNDPHRFAESGFLEEIIERTYVIYSKMTPSPLTEVQFRSDIVPSTKFLELIRRIVLNNMLYEKVKRVDGTVPQTVSVTLSSEWLRDISSNQTIQLDFSSEIEDEDDFIGRGFTTNSSPIPVIFNAVDLNPNIPEGNCILHISQLTPFFGAFGTQTPYPVSLDNSSNDLFISVKMNGVPVSTKTIFSLLNGTDSFVVKMTPDMEIETHFNNTLVNTPLPFNGGAFTISISRLGDVEISGVNDESLVSEGITLDLSESQPFSTILVSTGLSDIFTNSFGISEITLNQLT